MKKQIYLDVCALNRPFDDQDYLRVRLETEAVNLIISKIKYEKYELLVSPVHIKEVAAISNYILRIELQMIINTLGKPVKVNLSKARIRAEQLVDLGFGIADAAHVSFAEESNAEFITCDDKLIKNCKKHEIKIWFGNPLTFCEKESIR